MSEDTCSLCDYHLLPNEDSILCDKCEEHFCEDCVHEKEDDVWLCGKCAENKAPDGELLEWLLNKSAYGGDRKKATVDYFVDKKKAKQEAVKKYEESQKKKKDAKKAAKRKSSEETGKDELVPTTKKMKN